MRDFGIKLLPPDLYCAAPTTLIGHLRACADLEWMPSTLSRPSLRVTLAASLLGYMMIPVSSSGEIESLFSHHIKRIEELLLVLCWLSYVCPCWYLYF